MNVLDLFSGIGGFSLGLERAGFKTVAFCEIEAYPRAVLAKHWPGVPIYDDVRTLTAERLRADGISVDLICGGFPCQDISTAGKGAGIAEGTRSGLWSEFARLVGELRPRYVIVENVAALLGRGIGRVLGDLAEIGYDAEWQIISAADVGAPHLRERVWIVAYGNRDGEPALSVDAGPICPPDMADSKEPKSRARNHIRWRESNPGSCREDVADAYRAQREGRSLPSGVHQEHANACEHGGWEIEPDVGRVANGVPAGMDRLKALGNAVVPQIPEIIGRAIMQAEGLSA